MIEEVFLILKKKWFIFPLAFLFTLSLACLFEKKASAAITYSIVVKIQSNKAVNRKGVEVEVTGENLTTPQIKTTPKTGIVKFVKLAKGTYNVTPMKEGYTFDPPSRDVTFKKRRTVNISFKPKKLTYSINGTVTDPSGAKVANAKVVLIPDADVEGIESVQPLEDLANQADTKGYKTATTDSNGQYSFGATDVAQGNYFIFVIPSDSDHLPGGNISRERFSYAGSPLTKDIEISQVQSSSATYIGSTACLACHAKTSLTKTLHFVGLRKPGQVNSLQDLSLFTNADGALEKFDNVTTLYFHSLASGKYKVATSDPGSGVDFKVGLKKSGSSYSVTLTDVAGTSGSKDYNVEVTYGGEGLWKMRFITKGADGLYYILPIQYNEATGEWVEYNGTRWYSGGLTEPTPEQSFDVNCSGCHGGTGLKLTDGKFDMQFPPQTDGIDGEEWNIGCEKCHGPGSEHQAAGGLGKKIVMPEDLSAGRYAMICGTCHQRGKGEGVLDSSGHKTEFASVGDLTQGTDITIFKPGMSPAEFYGTSNGTGILPFEGITGASGGYFTPIDFSSDSNSWQDKTKGYGSSQINHSSGHHQQYLDIVRQKMFKNDRELVVCANCHDAHGSDQEHQLKYNNDNNAGCLVCHNGDDLYRDPTAHPANFQNITAAMVNSLISTGTADPTIGTEIQSHMSTWAGMTADYDPEGTGHGRCSKCHMPKTAKSAIWKAAKKFGDNQYYEGDIHSHTFDIIGKDVVEAMVQAGKSGTSVIPSPFTSSCGTCHTSNVL